MPYEGDPAEAEASEEEIRYLCDAVSEYLARPVTPDDVTSTYSGVRPLYDDMKAEDAQEVTRDYAFDVDWGGDDKRPSAPLLSIFGGKLTTFRKLAEHAMDELEGVLGGGGAWTRGAALPGGEMGYEGWDAWKTAVAARYPFLSQPLLDRLCAAYGTRIDRVLGEARSMTDLGRDYGCGLTEREVTYLKGEEFARTAEDVLERRTRLGLRMTPDEVMGLKGALV